MKPERTHSIKPATLTTMNRMLTRREEQILKMLLAEYTQPEICKVLKLHCNTVSDAKRRVMEKWNVLTMVGLVKEGIKRGYLELEEDHF
ncbi:MAG: hypothetical protein CL840_02105 [Crocinitomicaceae bacterium]|nr:hypothetical protein [Crocinitomicaceae bacterium]|tara:strand:- start:7545 stop:7811 length:267 start_codon:yes stop_codon:yes gene_type:complete